MPFAKVNCRKDLEEYVKDDPKSAKYIDIFNARYDLVMKLKTRRKELGYSQQYVAQMMGVTQQEVSRIETVTHDPSLGKLINYCNVIGVKLTVEF